MNKWIIIERTGYGSNFNHIMIDEKKTKIKKQAYTDYGIKKLRYEMVFYDFIKDRNINFLMPKIIEYNNDYAIMEYINSQSYVYDIKKLLSLLNVLHKSASISISKDEFSHHLLEETITKISKRLNTINTIICDAKITVLRVNNLNLYSIEFILDALRTFFVAYVDSLDEYIFCPIHGDPQYNNVICDANNMNMYFIDPKGYFGDMPIYGIKEYDIAKLYFSASGYDVFDDMDVDKLDIHNNELKIDFIKLQNGLEKEDKITIALFITIWLSNCHIFKNKLKVLLSHYIALYFASYYIDKICA